MKIEPEQPVAEKQTHLRLRGCLLSLSLTLICDICHDDYNFGSRVVRQWGGVGGKGGVAC